MRNILSDLQDSYDVVESGCRICSGVFERNKYYYHVRDCSGISSPVENGVEFVKRHLWGTHFIRWQNGLEQDLDFVQGFLELITR